MNRALLASAALLCAATVTGCATSETPMSTTWQITNIYINPETPSEPPNPAFMVFGNSTVTGNTGCSQFQGMVQFSPSVDEPERAQFRDMQFDVADCVGPQQFYHQKLTTILQGDFKVRRSEDEMVLTKVGELDPPGVRLVASH
ncbi:META domain-containing protein [Corynebacterium hindlerae]|uniref:META domain-containing protein n=1 Tax=Corynebacterium hindlerae TaxID=699041 RepID=UPI0031B6AA54